MANFNKFVITNLGRAMIADCQASAKTINITYCKTSSHNYYNDDLSILTALDDIEQSVLVSGKSSSGDTIKLESNLTNQSLALGYDFYTYGIYANNGSGDILFAVGVSDTADSIPAGSEAPWQTIIHSFVTISNSPNVMVNVDLAANATIGYVDTKAAELDDKKLDKLTTEGYYVYAHYDSTQEEIEVSDSAIAETIAQRDNNGNLFSNTPVGNSDTAIVNKGSLNRVTTVTIPNSGWSATATNGLYSITITGITNMYPSYVGTQDWDIVRTGSATDIETREEMASLIKRIESGTNQITVYATEKPTTAFQIRFFGL